MHACPVLHRDRRIWKHVQARVDHIGGVEVARLSQDVAPVQVSHLYIGQVQRSTRADAGRFDIPAVCLDASHPHLSVRRQQRHRVPGVNSARQHGACDNGAKSLGGEDPVNRQAKHTAVGAFGNLLDLGLQEAAQFRYAFARDR